MKNSEIILDILRKSLDEWVSIYAIIEELNNLSINEAREILSDLIRIYRPIIEYRKKDDCYRLRGKLPPDPKWINVSRSEFEN